MLVRKIDGVQTKLKVHNNPWKWVFFRVTSSTEVTWLRHRRVQYKDIPCTLLTTREDSFNLTFHSVSNVAPVARPPRVENFSGPEIIRFMNPIPGKMDRLPLTWNWLFWSDPSGWVDWLDSRPGPVVEWLENRETRRYACRCIWNAGRICCRYVIYWANLGIDE